jgi:hypothetical protein
MKKLLFLIPFLFLYSCNRQYECVEYKKINGEYTKEPLHIWFIYSHKEAEELNSDSLQYNCQQTKFRIKK